MGESTQAILGRGKRVLIGNYARLPTVMSRGEGAWLWDTDGKRYLDLFAGFGGAVLGHCHPDLVRAATEQAQKLWHVGNTFYSEPQIELAERLNRTAFAGQAFFAHGGADANEAAVKLARLRGQEHSPKRWKIISLLSSFHGRTLAMIAATGNPAVRAGFAPDVPGFVQVEAGNFDALAAAVDAETAGVIMEPIQGEGGINLYPDDYAAKARTLCDEKGLTMIFDEVWTGCGRTGRMFGHQYFKDAAGKTVEPDIMTLGKAIGGGLPVGVMFARPHVAQLLGPGKHGSTLGGNPIAMNVAKTIFDVIERDNLLEHASQLGEHVVARLRNEPKIHSKVAQIRGRGLMLGIELIVEPQRLVETGMEHGVLLNLTAKKVIRLAPPINVARHDWEQGLDRVVETIAAVGG
ncbi:MAG TPA: acetylornithine/succinylornithine family transaminase [Tepidisphaeraceae bacterium]|nr:acetylornithine/succinylornithine family transaminase [Tepidisphaeraceae bacterium]